MIFGKPAPGLTPIFMLANTKRVYRTRASTDGSVVKLTVWADGQGEGAGDQVMRGVVYDVSGVLLAQGDEVTVLDGQEGGWVDLPFSAYPTGFPVLIGVEYDIGVHAGENSNTIRLWGSP